MPGRKRALGVAAAVVAVIAIAIAAGAISLGSRQEQEAIAIALTGGDPARAPAHMRRYGCAGCHTIPGIAGADGLVGGPLSDIRRRVYIGGVVQNNAGNLVQWIVSPRTLDPRSAMPATGITEVEARDVAAYLYAR